MYVRNVQTLNLAKLTQQMGVVDFNVHETCSVPIIYIDQQTKEQFISIIYYTEFEEDYRKFL